MEMHKKELEVYIVGGEEFTSKVEAEKYEKELQDKMSRTYYRVMCTPDLTEGRGYFNSVVIAVQERGVSNAVLQFLIDNLGDPVSKVQGVSPINTWSVSKGFRFDNTEDLFKFLDTEVTSGLGDYKTRKVPNVIYIKDSGMKEEWCDGFVK